VPHPLDNPVLWSLAGAHARFAQRRGNAVRYQPDVAPFLALPDDPDQAGIRRHGKLVAMAGERLHPEGWSEISASAPMTPGAARDWLPGWSGQWGRSRARGEVPFLNAVATNPAIGLYERLGFRRRGPVLFAVARVPQAPLSGQAG
jgi:hypothetical protein